MLISEHGYEELSADHILVADAVDGVAGAVVVEDYPDALRGPSVLVLQKDAHGRPVHILWGIAKGRDEPAVVITGSPRSRSLVRGLFGTKKQMIRRVIKIIHEGRFAAEVPVDLIDEEGGWAPYLSLNDANKLDAVRVALRNGDVAAAGIHGRIFELRPVSA